MICHDRFVPSYKRCQECRTVLATRVARATGYCDKHRKRPRHTRKAPK